MTPAERASAYNQANPKRPELHCSQGWVTGTWCIGACYKNPNKLYGAYPHGYLARVHSMFPDAQSVLHLFSGGLTLAYAQQAAKACDVQLVDLYGPEQGRHPTWQGDVTALPAEWAGRFDLILADPPYSPSDAEIYGVKMPNCAKVIREARRVAKPGGNLVWLDTRWPMHRKTDWKTWGHIGLVRSTNHRMRLVTMFEAV